MKIKQKILQYMSEKKQKVMTFEQIAKDLRFVSVFDKQALAGALNQLVKEDKIVLTKNKKYTLHENTGAVRAVIIGNPNGYAFARPLEGEDVFVAERDLNGAVHGDTVLIKVEGKKSTGRVKGKKSFSKKQGQVIKIVERGYKTLVGYFQAVSGGAIVVPDDIRFTDSIFIPISKTKGAQNNTKVVVEILEYPTRTRMCQGQIIEVLGDANDFRVSTLSIIRSFGLTEEFPQNVLTEADRVNVPVTEEQLVNRKDFRNEPTITIDGEDARDFDDAISLKMKGENYLLSVHIADVANYVKEGGAIDKEAFSRGTSVYFPDHVLPMLPKVLSNGICSLNPNEDRLAMSVIMEFDKTGNIVDYHFYEGVIRSNYRMTYTNVTKIFDGDKELRKQYADILPMLEKMAELAKILLKRRDDAGQLDFDLPEAQINMNEDGTIKEIYKKPRNLSDRLIEQFMVVTNEVVARHFCQAKLPFVYRVHEAPSPERVKAFKEFVSSFGLKLFVGGMGYKPKDFQNILEQIKNTSYSIPISRVMLRSMQKARYAPENLGHFGLALKDYCHFTSPIRRYPDLVIHRILKLMIRNEFTANKLNILSSFVEQASEQASVTERRADDAERAVDDLKKAEYMSKRIGEIYKGYISGVTDGGIFVELDNTIEGYIYKEMLPVDNYIFDQARYLLVGKKNRFALGDPIEVKVGKVDINTRHIDFEIASQTAVK